jgi:hypothetical protein
VRAHECESGAGEDGCHVERFVDEKEWEHVKDVQIPDHASAKEDMIVMRPRKHLKPLCPRLLVRCGEARGAGTVFLRLLVPFVRKGLIEGDRVCVHPVLGMCHPARRCRK